MVLVAECDALLACEIMGVSLWVSPHHFLHIRD